MDRYKFLALVSLLIISGCQTTALWHSTPQDEYVRIVPDSPTDDVEVKLKTSGRKYYCADLYKNNQPREKICYSKITTAEKSKNVAIKLLKTPEMLVIDTSKTIYVVGYAVLSGFFQLGYHN